jgi:hypothetical protein
MATVAIVVTTHTHPLIIDLAQDTDQCMEEDMVEHLAACTVACLACLACMDEWACPEIQTIQTIQA